MKLAGGMVAAMIVKVLQTMRLRKLCPQPNNELDLHEVGLYLVNRISFDHISFLYYWLYVRDFFLNTKDTVWKN
jgi:hypothetical protein